MEPIIEFKNYTFKYDSQKNPTLYDINLKIYPGEKVLICGLSGSGKSTLGHAINGLIPFMYKGDITGEAYVNGMDTSKVSISELSKVCGTVLQDQDGQFVGLTVAEDIAFAMENDCVPVDEMHERVYDIAKKIELTDLLKSSPSELSGGQKQRVSLAGVMVDDVKILLFDEPLANLDPQSGRNTIELIDDISKKTGNTIIIIEHRLEDVLHKHVDRVILFDNGRIIKDETPDELLKTDILSNMGIREPLYLKAMKFSGIDVSKKEHLGYIEDLSLNHDEVSKIKEWVDENRGNRKKNGEPILKLENLCYSYDGIKKSIDDVSFNVNRGEILAIVGKNGAGKSTVSRLLSGFMKLDSGRILLNDRDIKDDTIFERGRSIGLVLQNPNQMICNTMIFDEVAYGLRNMHVDEDEIKERVYDALKICGLYPFRNWPISALSYGQKKRVTIASIIVMKPDLIVLDEPTAGQDFRHYTEIMTFLKELNDKGNTLVIITHDMHLMLEYCDRTVCLLDGKKIFDGTPEDIMTNSEIIDKASLKKTSLYDLAEISGLNPKDLTLSYINTERRTEYEG